MPSASKKKKSTLRAKKTKGTQRAKKTKDTQRTETKTKPKSGGLKAEKLKLVTNCFLYFGAKQEHSLRIQRKQKKKSKDDLTPDEHAIIANRDDEPEAYIDMLKQWSNDAELKSAIHTITITGLNVKVFIKMITALGMEPLLREFVAGDQKQLEHDILQGNIIWNGSRRAFVTSVITALTVRFSTIDEFSESSDNMKIEDMPGVSVISPMSTADESLPVLEYSLTTEETSSASAAPSDSSSLIKRERSLFKTPAKIKTSSEFMETARKVMIPSDAVLRYREADIQEARAANGYCTKN